MKTYHVQWSIDIEAESPRKEAEKAREIQLEPKYITSSFSVMEYNDFFRVMEYNDDAYMIDVKVMKIEESIEEQ